MAPAAEPLPAGRTARIRVPANSANLGPGFDSLGMAFDWYDECELEVLAEGVEVRVTGEGAETVPSDRTHLVIACLDRGLAALGAYAPGVRLVAHNTIPHTRGLGSSAAAAVAGLRAAWTLARPEVPVDESWLLEQAYAVEGHADNVAAAILGGFVLTWVDDETGAGVHAVPAPVHPDVRILAYVHAEPVATRTARGVLPESVPHAEAAANAARAALLTHALGRAPELLLPATREWLHQDQRTELMPESLDLLKSLRAKGFGAVISGAGPTVLVLTDADRAAQLDGSEAPGFALHRLGLGRGATSES
ncbi:homoserine kinase [Enemella evansiae]|uniref:homoserine kinase n=1 Tax=Enemella evansiae TaxID=2016499 RepID=UPI000B97A5C3|nr:homoserine kinase [Enemella evansiae]OYO05032.1 homoserine kinase [Enemella evansiae]